MVQNDIVRVQNIRYWSRMEGAVSYRTYTAVHLHLTLDAFRNLRSQVLHRDIMVLRQAIVDGVSDKKIRWPYNMSPVPLAPSESRGT